MPDHRKYLNIIVFHFSLCKKILKKNHWSSDVRAVGLVPASHLYLLLQASFLVGVNSDG